jgi:hypothetical protein
LISQIIGKSILFKRDNVRKIAHILKDMA